MASRRHRMLREAGKGQEVANEGFAAKQEGGTSYCTYTNVLNVHRLIQKSRSKAHFSMRTDFSWCR